MTDFTFIGDYQSNATLPDLSVILVEPGEVVTLDFEDPGPMWIPTRVPTRGPTEAPAEAPAEAPIKSTKTKRETVSCPEPDRTPMHQVSWVWRSR